MTYLHPEEEFQVWRLERYEREHPRSVYIVEFANAERYECEFDAAFDSDNGGELEIEDDNPLYDEFHQVVMRITRTVSDGLRPYEQYLCIDYRDWPVVVEDLDTGTLIYPAAECG